MTHSSEGCVLPEKRKRGRPKLTNRPVIDCSSRGTYPTPIMNRYLQHQDGNMQNPVYSTPNKVNSIQGHISASTSFTTKIHDNKENICTGSVNLLSTTNKRGRPKLSSRPVMGELSIDQLRSSTNNIISTPRRKEKSSFKGVNLLSTFEMTNDSISSDSELEGNIEGGTYSSDSDCMSVDKHQDTPQEYLNLGPPSEICEYCKAIMWKEERNNKSAKSKKCTFSLCCCVGEVELPSFNHPPSYLASLLMGGANARHFRDNIRAYNSMFAYTSIGGNVDKLINKGNAPYCFRLNGQNHHQIGSLLPVEGKKPQFCQLYFYDTQNEVTNRIAAVEKNKRKRGVKPDIVSSLIRMFDETNPLAKLFRQARERFYQDNVPELKIVLKESRAESGRPNHITPSSEVAALIVGDNDPNCGERDVIVHTKTKGLQRISFIHPLFMAMQYPVLFPFGEDGFHPHIKYKIRNPKRNKKRKYVTMKEYYSYLLQMRLNQGTTLRWGQRLYQQFVVDAFSVIEQSRLHWYKTHQSTVRAELYQNICDHVSRGDGESESIGKSFILPASFTGSRRYLNQNFLDSLAICRSIGHPDLFITMTCNPKWPELQSMLDKTPGIKPEDAPDLVARVFKLKLDQFMKVVRDKNFFGRCIGALYVIEFQKRGLPHAHMLFWIHSDDKPKTADQVNSFVSAEIPDKNQDPVGYEAVKQFMIHGPCGDNNLSASCMDTAKSRCTRHFPKRYCNETSFDDGGFPLYRRRKTNLTVVKKDDELDNRWVVPYNRDLIVMFQCHINVEVCNHSRSLKYLFKYCLKGHDRATMILQRKKEAKQTTTKNSMTLQSNTRSVGDSSISGHVDEIQQYLDGRYICAAEAAHRIFGFHMHYRNPAVERLPIHLEDMQSITYKANEDLTAVVNRAKYRQTKLQAWFEANKIYPEARNLYYQQFPSAFVWDRNLCKWTIRKQGFVVGRIMSVHATSGELFYLRMLLTRCKGVISFENLRTVRGHLYPTFKEACDALGLLDNDKEWHEAIHENSHHASAAKLRELFVHIIVHCQVSNPLKLWNEHREHFQDDILYNRRRLLNDPDLQLSEVELHNFALAEVERILRSVGKSLKNIAGMPYPTDDSLLTLQNMLIIEETSYDVETMKKEHEDLYSRLNIEQTKIYNDVIQSVHQNRGGLFFVYGSGGCGKTYLWRTIISKLRSEKKIVLSVASSGIAAVLLPGGRTAHSRFHIPIILDDDSSCAIKLGSDIAELLQNTSLIIWDEAPMQQKQAFEAVDRSIRDIMKVVSPSRFYQPFGGITFVLGGDFRQILPVLDKGSRHDIVSSCINRSYLWEYVNIYVLTQNMRLSHGNANNKDIESFTKWVLDIGEGKNSYIKSTDNPNEDPEVEIPERFILRASDDPIVCIIDCVYHNFLENYRDAEYLKSRSILAPTNKSVNEINARILAMLPGESHSYLSQDSIDEGLPSENELHSAFPEEYLNTIEMPGLPNHELTLKEGCEVMLMRNLNQLFGLCNGTRMIVTKLYRWTVECEIITGNHAGMKHIIPRLVMEPSDSKWPFVFRRKQFPLQLCFAMTINKSQGQSLEKVGLYLSKPTFTHGQLYVAVSRVTSPEGLHILIDSPDGGTSTTTKNIVYNEVFYNLPQ